MHIDSDVISKESADYILTHLMEAKDKGVIGDMAWCKIALSVLRHLYFSDFSDIAHQCLKVGKEKSSKMTGNVGSKLWNRFDSIESHWRI